MASSSQGLNSELESFRQQWLSEVRTKRSERPRQSSAAHSHSHSSPTVPVSPQRSKARPPSPTKTRKGFASAVDEEDGNAHSHPRVFEGSPEPSGNTTDGSAGPPLGKELVSALDHYEEAMAKEAEGNMGDSLKLYRRAYRLDNRVDRRYREKHFPQPHTSQPSPLPQSTAAQTPEDQSATSLRPPVTLLPIEHLIASFSRLRIEPAPPEVEGSPPPPSPISSLPRELLVHITRDLLHLHRDNAHASNLPSAVMQKAYKGRWRLSSSFGEPQSGADEARQPRGREGHLAVETETHDPKYMFRMDLSLRTAGKGSKNNKLVWRGHFSYNKLTDDWAEFTLKHDKAFFFSRVKSYGMGE